MTRIISYLNSFNLRVSEPEAVVSYVHVLAM